MSMDVTGPVLIVPGCHLWIAFFFPHSINSLTQQQRDLSAAVLSPADLQRWHQYRPPEKRRQFLNSRLAVRHVLEREFGTNASGIFLKAGPRGQPILVSSDAQQCPPISLSHSGSAVAVAISHQGIQVGVDIESVEPLKTSALRSMTVNSSETTLCQRQNALSETEFLRTLWTIRESVWKSLGGSGEITSSEICLSYDESGLLHPRVTHPAVAEHRFTTQLFAVQCEERLPNTLIVEPPEFCVTSFRGAVTLRIPRAAGKDCCELADHCHLPVNAPYATQ